MLEDVDRSSGKEMLDLEQSWIEDRDGLQKLFYDKAAKLIVGATAAAPPVVVSRRTPTGRLIGRRIGAVQVQDSDKLRGDGKGKGVIIYSLDCIPGTEQNEACDHHDAVKSLYDYVVAFWASALGKFEFSEHHRDIFLSRGEKDWAMIEPSSS